MLKHATVFIKRTEIANLLKETERFWTTEKIRYHEERLEYLRILKILKNIFKAYWILIAVNVSLFLIISLILKNENLVFRIYRIESIPRYALLLLELFTFLGAIIIPAISLDLFILSLMILVSTQFKIVNTEFERLFNDVIPEKDLTVTKRSIKETVDHHSFLLDFVNRMNNVFSASLLIYLGVIVLSVCTEMYLISVQDSFKKCIQPAAYIVQGLVQYAFCYCLPAQIMTNEVGKLKKAENP
ncbi:hypothetical protein NQ315_016508 [Exocentrus adspersus]|uniref:Uncharacterized protein n=1 Tax=Exocentrus adspersus TaxID=1586481 RepID=A0AAV8VYW5_9CUCU|nr:hypothetical protein NQ315_016508 [Exocentrus adspersus]